MKNLNTEKSFWTCFGKISVSFDDNHLRIIQEAHIDESDTDCECIDKKSTVLIDAVVINADDINLLKKAINELIPKKKSKK